MKKTRILLIVVLGLSLVFMLSMANMVFAADGNGLDQFFTTNTLNSNNTTTNNTTTNSSDDGFTDLTSQNTSNTVNTTNITNNTSSGIVNTTTNNTINTTNNTAVNRSVSNTNTLASTGLADNGALVLVVLVSIISAIYSFKKINDYKKI